MLPECGIPDVVTAESLDVFKKEFGTIKEEEEEKSVHYLVNEQGW